MFVAEIDHKFISMACASHLASLCCPNNIIEDNVRFAVLGETIDVMSLPSKHPENLVYLLALCATSYTSSVVLGASILQSINETLIKEQSQERSDVAQAILSLLPAAMERLNALEQKRPSSLADRLLSGFRNLVARDGATTRFRPLWSLALYRSLLPFSDAIGHQTLWKIHRTMTDLE
eukprot:TRINITY_DN7775_c0_g1_i3.p1 TRINITY_DN7775_c0_g1~~TRINITY_DN7775_c0_g1_i3.p1  ORF type:complete len:178 (+),score=28.21 TRINITY_DN7775_c0_g1_i3:277-810(+)